MVMPIGYAGQSGKKVETAFINQMGAMNHSGSTYWYSYCNQSKIDKVR